MSSVPSASGSAALASGAPAPLPSPPSSVATSESEDLPGTVESPSSPLGVYSTGGGDSLAALTKKFEAWADKSGARVSLVVLDPESSTFVSEIAPDALVNPASNQKLFTAAAALAKLGSSYRFRTEIRGELDAEGRVEALELVGGGAPDLTSSDWIRMLRSVVRLGTKTIGTITVDQSRFASSPVPPGFEQQPGEWAPFRAPVSALALDRNTLALEVVPTRVGERARYYYEPPGIVLPDESSLLTEEGKADRVQWQLAPSRDGSHLASRLSGSIGSEAGRHRYARRLDDPLLAPGYAAVALLNDWGVKVGSGPRLGASSAKQLVRWDSAPLREIVGELGKDSDNFTAEMLLVALSAAEPDGAKKSWSTESGLAVLRKFVSEVVPKSVAEQLVFKNGSGLFDSNRVTTRSMALLLAEMRKRPDVFPEFLAQLAIGGVDGTLSRRFVSKRARVRAKTGTLRDAIALSGYAERRGGKAPLVFSIVVSGPPKALGGARDAIDHFVLSLVDS